MKKIILCAALATVLPAACLAQSAFTVNGQLISSQSLKDAADSLKASGVKDDKQREELAKNVLINQAVIEQTARKEKIDQLPIVKMRIDDARTRIYTDELIRRNVLNKPVTEEEIKKLYEASQKAYNPTEISVRHILVKTEGEAKDLIAKIKAGGDFAALAKQKTEDKGTAETGGLIPFTNVRQFAIPGFAESAATLKKGEILGIPFKSPLGYHVVRLEDERTVEFPTYDQIKGQIEARIQSNNAQKYIEGLIKDAKIGQSTKSKK